MGDYIIVTHTDLDGVASAALILKYLKDCGVGKVDVRFTQPYRLHKVLMGLRCSRLYVCDLGINVLTYTSIVNELRRLLNEGTEVYWFDHHVWDSEWVEGLKGLGVSLYVDRSTCTAGLVASYLGLGDRDTQTLVRATCSNDLWVFNDYLGCFLSRYVACRKGNRWRRYVVDRLVEFGGVIDEEIVRCAEAVVNRDLSVIDRALRNSLTVDVEGVRVVLTMRYTDESSISYLAHYLMSKLDADIAVVCKGGGLSIRSRDLDVRDLAVRLGGGGHPKAAGAPLRLSLIYRLLLILRLRGPVLRYCSKLVARELREILYRRSR